MGTSRQSLYLFKETKNIPSVPPELEKGVSYQHIASRNGFAVLWSDDPRIHGYSETFPVERFCALMSLIQVSMRAQQQRKLQGAIKSTIKKVKRSRQEVKCTSNFAITWNTETKPEKSRVFN